MKRSVENKLFSLLNKVDDLPTLPEVVEKLIAKLYDTDISTEELARSISSDASLASKVFKLVNSAYYGFPRKISTISQAIVFLGFNSLKNIVLTASVFEAFKEDGRSSEFERKKFWEHSLGCAVISKILSKELRYSLPEEVFFAGLIHDIGKIVLDQFLHKEFLRVLQKIAKEGVSFYKAEMEILGANHSDVGAWLCEKWNFPMIFQASVSYHHFPEFANAYQKIAAIVDLANCLAKREGFGLTINSEELEFSQRSLEIVNLTTEEIEELTPAFHEDFKKANIFLELVV